MIPCYRCGYYLFRCDVCNVLRCMCPAERQLASDGAFGSGSSLRWRRHYYGKQAVQP